MSPGQGVQAPPLPPTAEEVDAEAMLRVEATAAAIKRIEDRFDEDIGGMTINGNDFVLDLGYRQKRPRSPHRPYQEAGYHARKYSHQLFSTLLTANRYIQAKRDLVYKRTASGKWEDEAKHLRNYRMEALLVTVVGELLPTWRSSLKMITMKPKPSPTPWKP